jgi:hypothetical protein
VETYNDPGSFRRTWRYIPGPRVAPTASGTSILSPLSVCLRLASASTAAVAPRVAAVGVIVDISQRSGQRQSGERS